MTEQISAGTSILNAFLKVVVFVLIVVVFLVFLFTALYFLNIPVDFLPEFPG